MTDARLRQLELRAEQDPSLRPALGAARERAGLRRCGHELLVGDLCWECRGPEEVLVGYVCNTQRINGRVSYWRVRNARAHLVYPVPGGRLHSFCRNRDPYSEQIHLLEWFSPILTRSLPAGFAVPGARLHQRRCKACFLHPSFDTLLRDVLRTSGPDGGHDNWTNIFAEWQRLKLQETTPRG